MGLGVRTDSPVTTKIFEIDGLPIFFKVWGSARAPSSYRSSAKSLYIQCSFKEHIGFMFNSEIIYATKDLFGLFLKDFSQFVTDANRDIAKDIRSLTSQSELAFKAIHWFSTNIRGGEKCSIL